VDRELNRNNLFLVPAQAATERFDPHPNKTLASQFIATLLSRPLLNTYRPPKGNAMLDTRMPPISTRLRRSYPSARSETRLPKPRQNQPRQTELRMSARSASRSQAQAALVREQIAAEPLRRAPPSVRSSRLSRSEMRLMGLATTCTAVVCALLLLYLAAYAQVTQLGIAQASARTELHRNQLRSELLQAERNALESPQRIIAATAVQGMVPRGRTPVNYIRSRSGEAGERPL